MLVLPKLLVGEGGRGGIAGGRRIANDKRVNHATSDLRNEASALGSNYVPTDPPPLGAFPPEDVDVTTPAPP